MAEASPICRGKNLTLETVLAFINALPYEVMSKSEFMKYGEERLNGWRQTHSQIARQMALYYEDENGYCHPRFTSKVKREDLIVYVCKWAERYFIPNLYTPSLNEYKSMCTNIYSFLKSEVENGENSYSNACKKIFGIEMNNLDKVRVYLNSFTDLIIDDDIIRVNDSLANISEYDIHPNIDINSAEEYYNYFNLKNVDSHYDKVNTKSSLQQIYYGAPGTGKSHKIKELVDEKGESVVRTTFHPDSDYSTFVGAYKPTTIKEPRYTSLGEKAIKMKNADGGELMEDRIVYEFVAQAFLKAYVKAWEFYAEAGEDEPQKQFLVIEEINRGNCAQIFGDLFQLLDRNEYGFSDYYIHADSDLKAYLTHAFDKMSIAKKEEINGYYKGNEDIVKGVLEGDILLLPNNLYIWATMNTSDQSLFPIDSAFKRRWDWVYVPIANVADKPWTIVIGDKTYGWWDFLEKINEQVGATTNSQDKKLGFFFCQADNDGVIDANKFINKVLFYLWNDVFKDYGFEGELFKTSDGEILTFDKFFHAEKGTSYLTHWLDKLIGIERKNKDTSNVSGEQTNGSQSVEENPINE